MTLIDYHNHTSLCGHATGSIEEYIENAIAKGVTEFGISDHAPLPKGMREQITMSEDQVDSYINEVSLLKKIYENRINLRLGFEVDFPIFDSFPERYYTHPEVDYLIGSCHYLGDWPFDHPDYADEFFRKEIDKVYEEYYRVIEKIISSNLFDIVAHFDLIKKFGNRPNKNFEPVIKKIASLASKTSTVIEINTSGLLKPVEEIYPSDDIIQIFFDCNVPITIGSDSHSPENVAYMIPETIEKLKKTGYRKFFGFKNRKKYQITI